MMQTVKSKKYLGYEYAVRFYSNEWTGWCDWYCGYVKIPKNNNLYGLKYYRNMPYLVTQDADYAEIECKKLIDQIVALEKEKNHDF